MVVPKKHVIYAKRYTNDLAPFFMYAYTKYNLTFPLFSFYFQAKMEVEDLFTDLADGIKLLKLLEIISGEKLGKPNNGRMRVHKIENVNKSLAFLHTKVSR